MPLWYGKPVEVRADRTPRAGPRWVPNWARLLLVVGKSPQQRCCGQRQNGLCPLAVVVVSNYGEGKVSSSG